MIQIKTTGGGMPNHEMDRTQRRNGINHAHTTEKKQPLEKTLSTNLTYRKEKSYSWFSAK